MARPQCDTPLVYFLGGRGGKGEFKSSFFFFLLKILSFLEKNWEIAENKKKCKIN
jgi:hypothetical protein